MNFTFNLSVVKELFLTENSHQQAKMGLPCFTRTLSSHFSWLQDFPRIHQIFGVERLFQWMHNFHGCVSHLLTQQCPLPYAHSMLPCACASHGEGSPGDHSSLITTQHNVKKIQIFAQQWLNNDEKLSFNIRAIFSLFSHLFNQFLDALTSFQRQHCSKIWPLH